MAVYALFIPLSRRFLEIRAKSVIQALAALKEAASKTKPSVSEERLEKLADSVTQIKTMRVLPRYLREGILAVFVGYNISALLALGWIVNWQNLRLSYDTWLPIAFGFSTLLFFIVGVYIVTEINETLEKEFEEIKKRVEFEDAKARALEEVQNLIQRDTKE